MQFDLIPIVKTIRPCYNLGARRGFTATEFVLYHPLGPIVIIIIYTK